jgi:hypothetical protein
MPPRMTNPSWWNEKHEGTWARMKDALKRDWEQTKHDLSSKKAPELHQNAGDTVKQAAGKEPIPAGNQPNPKWDEIEPAYRYAAGAHEQYGETHKSWDTTLEQKLSSDWKDVKSGHTWDEVKETVRHAWDSTKSRKS